jgi:uncharacterized membrane protein
MTDRLAVSSPWTRYPALDLLRGIVVVLMALDHTRDYVHAAAMDFPPESLARTTVAVFLTRWVTHVCAPVFMFAAGLGAALRLDRLVSRRELSVYLATRGLWLIVLELTVVRLGFFFRMDAPLVFLLVFWALGLSMIGLAVLIHLPPRALLVVSLALIGLHNLADGVTVPALDVWSGLWRVLHQPGPLLAGPPTVIVGYPLVPWIGVMALGFCCGPIVRRPDAERRRIWLAMGAAACLAFVLLRGLNVYGDPRPWSLQPQAGFTLLSFLNTSKYPPSLAFLLMTLGPAWLALAWGDRLRPRDSHPLTVFGRAPLLFFVLHIPLIHAVALGMTWLRYGAAPFLLVPPPTLGTDRAAFPPDYGWPLWTVYIVWLAVIVVMYPVCRWRGRAGTARRRSHWLAYI